MAGIAQNAEWAGGGIVVTGLDATRNALDRWAPDARRALDRKLKATGEVVAETARRNVSGGADPSRSKWSIVGVEQVSAAANGIRVSRRRGGMQVRQDTKPGSIIEFAAASRSLQGAAMVAVLEREYGSPGRVLWDAWEQLDPWVQDQVAGIITDSEAALQAAMDRAG